jgi:hypothetical protein
MIEERCYAFFMGGQPVSALTLNFLYLLCNNDEGQLQFLGENLRLCHPVGPLTLIHFAAVKGPSFHNKISYISY